MSAKHVHPSSTSIATTMETGGVVTLTLQTDYRQMAVHATIMIIILITINSINKKHAGGAGAVDINMLVGVEPLY